MTRRSGQRPGQLRTVAARLEALVASSSSSLHTRVHPLSTRISDSVPRSLYGRVQSQTPVCTQAVFEPRRLSPVPAAACAVDVNTRVHPLSTCVHTPRITASASAHPILTLSYRIPDPEIQRVQTLSTALPE
eukprot:2594417-Rhodomonas_salina.1